MVRSRGEGTELLSRHDIRGAVRPTSIPDGLFHAWSERSACGYAEPAKASTDRAAALVSLPEATSVDG